MVLLVSSYSVNDQINTRIVGYVLDLELPTSYLQMIYLFTKYYVIIIDITS